MSQTKHVHVDIRNPFNKNREQLIAEIRSAVKRLEERPNGCEVSDILTASGALLALGEGASCCWCERHVKE